MAGCAPILAVDAWSVAARTYQENFPEATVLTDRVENIDPVTALGRREVDLLLASPECTNHSPAKGAAKRSEASRRTAFEVIRWVKVLKPRWVILENVVQMQNWKKYAYLVTSLRKLRYHVKEVQLNAADFGTPQVRKRLFLVADREMEIPAITATSEIWNPATIVLDLPGTWQTQALYTPSRAKKTLARAERAIAQLGAADSFLLVYYGSDGSGGWQPLSKPLRTVTTIDRFGLVEVVDGQHRMRMLQPPELARAMGLPPDHLIRIGSRRDRIKLCGNGICAPVIQAIVEQVIGPHS